jgi:hypothetical protein
MSLFNLHPARALLFVLLLSLNIYAQAPPRTDPSEIDELASTLVSLKSSEERQQVSPGAIRLLSTSTELRKTSPSKSATRKVSRPRG